MPQGEWKPIETSPMDGTEILGWRDDAGVILIRYTSLSEFMTDSELEGYDEETIFQEDWFFADFVHGGRLDEEPPTHWQALPEGPDQ